MKAQLLSTALLCCILPATADDYTGWQVTNPEWQLVFSDDFNGTTLDATKWNSIDYVGWNVSDWRTYQSNEPELVTVNGDGTVSLWGKYGNYTSQSNPSGAAPTYACGGIFTDKTFNFQYGYVEVRAKFDCAQGAWPAIWMMPTDGSNWPKNGEIDILEHLNYEGIAHQTLHFNNADGKNTSLGTVNGGSTAYYSDVDSKLDFHTYGVEWTTEGISFLMDGKKTLTVAHQDNNPNWPFNKENNPFYLLLDMQLGGDWVGEIGNIGDGVAMTVDYVRVYSTPQVPEPTSTALSTLALAILAGRRRRK
ncbi:MAG: family 16 glycosylhydrolase [Akkermansia sp.]|nr:family 16 glycosylhydrolase [Akkermansia sp.]